MIHALGEGIYQLSAERNPHIVKLSAYAPSLQNRNSYAWTPNLISFTAKQTETVLTTSYWQQWLFSTFRGDCNIPVVNTVGDMNPLFWVGNINNESGSVLLKVRLSTTHIVTRAEC
jgi:alpha-N-arabinofuranosidase